MAIDATIALGQQPGNLLSTLSGVTQLRGVTQQQQANVAASEAYKEATDPATGQIDYNRLTSLLSQGPAAYNLPQIQAQINEARNSAQQYDTSKLEMAKKRTDLLSGGFGGLLASGNVTPQSVMQIASQGIRQGLFTPEDAVSFTSDMPTDPAQLQNWAKQKYVGFSTDASKLQSLMPQTQVLNNGATQQIMAIDPLTGRPTVTGAINNTMAPGDANSLVPVYNDSTGQMDYKTKQQAADQLNGQGQPGSTLGLPGTGGNGRYPGAQGQTQGQGQQPQSLSAGPALGAAGAADVIGKGSAESAMNLQSQASGAPDRIRFLQDMTADLEHFTSGPGADFAAKAKALALQMDPTGVAAQLIDPQSVASKEGFTKYAAQLAMNSMKGMGTGTDSQLATTVSGNPHADLSKLGLQQIMQVLTGTERATLAKNQAWQNAGVAPQNYGKWESTWNSQVDPRVFVTPEMTQAQVSTMYKGLKPADQARFKSSLRTAIDAGIIPNPATQAPAQ